MDMPRRIWVCDDITSGSCIAASDVDAWLGGFSGEVSEAAVEAARAPDQAIDASPSEGNDPTRSESRAAPVSFTLSERPR